MEWCPKCGNFVETGERCLTCAAHLLTPSNQPRLIAAVDKVAETLRWIAHRCGELELRERGDIDYGDVAEIKGRAMAALREYEKAKEEVC